MAEEQQTTKTGVDPMTRSAEMAGNADGPSASLPSQARETRVVAPGPLTLWRVTEAR